MLASLFAFSGYAVFAILPRGAGSLTKLPLILLALYNGVNFGCMWSSLLLSIPKEAASRMLGVAFTCQNLLYAVFPLMTGYIYRDRTSAEYKNWVYFMMAYISIAVFFALVVFLGDLRGDKMLLLPENDPKVVRMQEKLSYDFRNSVLRKERERSSSGPQTEYATFGGDTYKTWKNDTRSPAETKLVNTQEEEKQVGVDDDQEGKFGLIDSDLDGDGKINDERTQIEAVAGDDIASKERVDESQI